MKSFFIHYKTHVSVIVISLLVTILSIKLNDPRNFSPDSIWYHNYAYNLIENNVYTYNVDGNIQPNFFREPGYPYYIAFNYYIYSFFEKINPIGEEDFDRNEGLLKEENKAIVFVRFAQGVLLAFSVLFFFITIKDLFPKKMVLFIILIVSTYYPFFVFSNNLLRENLLIFLFIILTYFYKLYLKNHQVLFLLFASIIVGIICLTFQAMLIITPSIIILVLLANRSDFFGIVKHGIIAGLAFIFTVTPWLIKVYDYYPDPKIIKTIGSSLTHESLVYASSIRSAYSHGLISKEELYTLEHENWYLLSSKEIFDRSFNGWYQMEADSIYNVIDEKQSFHNSPEKFNLEKMKNYGIYFLNVFRHSNWAPAPSLSLALKNKEYLIVPFHFYSYLLAFFAIIGLFVIPPKRLIYFIPYILLMVFFWKLGGEGRRLIPALPFVLLLSVLGYQFFLKVFRSTFKTT